MLGRITATRLRVPGYVAALQPHLTYDPIIPKASHRNVGYAFLKAKCLEHIRIERAGQRQCCASVASFSPAFKREPRRSEISQLDEIVSALAHGGQFVPVQLPGNGVGYCTCSGLTAVYAQRRRFACPTVAFLEIAPLDRSPRSPQNFPENPPAQHRF